MSFYEACRPRDTGRGRERQRDVKRRVAVTLLSSSSGGNVPGIIFPRVHRPLQYTWESNYRRLSDIRLVAVGARFARVAPSPLLPVQLSPRLRPPLVRRANESRQILIRLDARDAGGGGVPISRHLNRQEIPLTVYSITIVYVVKFSSYLLRENQLNNLPRLRFISPFVFFLIIIFNLKKL